MPAMLDDPTSPLVHRTSGKQPFIDTNMALPSSIQPQQVTLRNSRTASIIPFLPTQHVPQALCHLLCDTLNEEIEQGDTYPMVNTLERDAFAKYWFGLFGVVVLAGSLKEATELLKDPRGEHDVEFWRDVCLGSYYIKPNYPGRSSHVCNAGFLVCRAARGAGAGRLLGESYLIYAPALGYRYSVFNLVYENNVASTKIWDALGFERIGRVPGCGNLKSWPGKWVDAIQYGRWLVPESERGDVTAGKV